MKSLEIKQSITNRESRSLKAYFNEIKEIKVLTHEEEYQLAYEANKGNEEAREKLVKHNLRFVISVAKQYETPFLNLEDLINEGNVGLVVASTKFDPSRGFKFLSYAVYWIRRYILTFIADNGKTIRLPNNKINILTKLKEEYMALEQKLQRKPSYGELVGELEGQYSEDEIAFYYGTANNNIISLDLEVGHEGSSTALVNLIEDTSSINASHYVDATDNKIKHHRILSFLNKDIEREVIKLIYGLDGHEVLPLKTIGFLLGMTSERVRQIRDDSLKQLKIGFKTIDF